MDKPILWVVETGSLSGGVRVILEYANRLAAKYGYKNIIYSLNERPEPKHRGGWFDLSPKVEWIRFGGYEALTKAAINLNPEMAIATWWKTAYCVKEIAEKTGCRGLYLVQDIETSYYVSPIERSAVEATYTFNLEHFTTSKWVMSQLPDARYVGLAIGKWQGDDKVSRSRDVLACLRVQALKGFRELTETARYLIASNIRLVTFGHGTKIQITSLHTHNPPDGNFLNDRQVEKLYSRVGVFISTSKHEGLSMTPLEAMSSGCPVIMFNAQGNMEYAVDGENCLIATSPRDLADKIVKVLSDRDLARRLSISGQKTAKAYISWDAVIERLKLVVDNPPPSVVNSES